jgi:hypothetical protein
LLFKPRHAHGADAPVIVGEREATGFDLVDTTVDDVSRDAAARAGMTISPTFSTRSEIRIFSGSEGEKAS